MILDSLILNFRNSFLLISGLAYLYGRSHGALSFFLILIGCLLIRDQFIQVIYTRFLSPIRSIPTVRPKWFEKYEQQGYAPWAKYHLKHGTILRLVSRTALGREVIIISDPKAIMEIFMHKGYIFQKPAMTRKFLSNFLGTGLVTVEGEVHREQKKLLLPAFHHSRIKELVPIFNDCSKIMCDKWDGIITATGTSSAEIDVFAWFGRSSLDMVGQGGFGFDFEALTNPTAKLANLYWEVFTVGGSKRGQFGFALHILFGPIFMKVPIKLNQDCITLNKLIIANARRMIANARANKIRQKNILAIMLEEALKIGIEPDEDSMVQQCMSFLGAGHETTSTAMSWMCFLLAKPENQWIQKKLRSQLKDVWSDQTRLPTWEELESCQFLFNIIREALRLIPPIPAIARIASQDTTIGPYFIPKGTAITACPAEVNIDPTFWGADAAAMNPDRWLDLPKDFSNGSFLSFLYGPRGCIGYKFAYTEMKVLLAQIIARFKIDLVPGKEDYKFKSSVITRPDGGKIELILTKV